MNLKFNYFFALLAVLFSQNCYSQIDQEALSELEFAHAAISDNHRRVNSGVMRIHGNYKVEKDGLRYGGPFKHLEAFDYNKALRTVLYSFPKLPKNHTQGIENHTQGIEGYRNFFF